MLKVKKKSQYGNYDHSPKYNGKPYRVNFPIRSETDKQAAKLLKSIAAIHQKTIKSLIMDQIESMI